MTTTELDYRARVREVLLAASSDGATATPLLVEEADNLAERLYQALYHIDAEDERVIEEWAAGEVADREATRTTLERLKTELRESFDLYQDDRGAWRIDGAAFPCPASAMPELRAVLAEEVSRG